MEGTASAKVQRWEFGLLMEHKGHCVWSSRVAAKDQVRSLGTLAEGGSCSVTTLGATPVVTGSHRMALNRGLD